MNPISSRRRRGFTLIEVLMVLIILVIIASLAVSSYSSTRTKAMMQAATAQIGLFKTPLEMFNLDMGRYPTTAEQLQVLRYAPADAASGWNGPYLDSEVPLDPWKREYRYMYPGRYNTMSYDIWSTGPSGIDGNADNIGNWILGR
jgi:general secretion pathway protein G